VATARIVDSFWTCAKRRRTERYLAAAGHRWPADPGAGPMSGAECIGRLLAMLDGRGDPRGSLEGLDDAEIELEAGWVGEAGLLVRTLVECGWIDVAPDGSRRWHDFGSFNSRVLTLRAHASEAGRTSAARRGDRGPDGRWGSPGSNGESNGRTNGESNGQPNGGPNREPNGRTNWSGSGSGSGSESSSPEEKNPAAAAAAPAPAARRGASVAPTAEGLALAEHLLDAIRAHSPAFKAPARLDAWARDLDLTLRRDGRTPEAVRAAIDFAHRDPRGAFWRPNILSGASLRRQFDRLAIADGTRGGTPTTAGAAPRRTTAAEQLRIARAEAGIDGAPR
jgi:hypothetical protein